MIGYDVGVELDNMNERERNMYSRGISQAYGAVFERLGQVIEAGGDVTHVVQLVNADFEMAIAAQTVRGVL